MPSNLTVEDKKIIHSLFWRSLALEGSFNYEKMQALGFAWAMFPVIKKYHKTKEAQAEALKRHTAFFNISPPLVTFPLLRRSRKSPEATATEETCRTVRFLPEEQRAFRDRFPTWREADDFVLTQ